MIRSPLSSQASRILEANCYEQQLHKTASPHGSSSRPYKQSSVNATAATPDTKTTAGGVGRLRGNLAHVKEVQVALNSFYRDGGMRSISVLVSIRLSSRTVLSPPFTRTWSGGLKLPRFLASRALRTILQNFRVTRVDLYIRRHTSLTAVSQERLISSKPLAKN